MENVCNSRLVEPFTEFIIINFKLRRRSVTNVILLLFSNMIPQCREIIHIHPHSHAERQYDGNSNY